MLPQLLGSTAKMIVHAVVRSHGAPASTRDFVQEHLDARLDALDRQDDKIREILHPRPPGETIETTAVVLEDDEPERLAKPGCTAADETGAILHHLNGLARGLGGFGVLRSPDERKRIERAVRGALGMGEEGVARRMGEVFADLKDVSTPEQAAALADRLGPVADEAWELGKRCGGTGAIALAQHLMERAQAGEITKQAALAELLAAGDE